jgi:hypothetical protein
MSRQSRSKVIEWRLMLVAAIALLIFISSACPAAAIGVTPGRTTIDFEPGADKSVSFTITNNDHKQFNAYIYVEGDMKDYITFDKQIIPFNESDNSKVFTYRVKLPQRIDPPGDHWGKIIVMELPAGWEAPEGETRIIATVAVIHQLRVKVPYPGKFMQIDLTIQEAVPNESVKFFVKLYNLGKEDLAKAQATIEVFGPTNEVIATVDTEPVAVKSMERGELIAAWKAQVNPGMYHAVVTVRYDGEVGKTDKNFYVGNMLIDLLDVTVKDFKLGGIAKFDILAESRWNQPIPGVYAHLIVNDNKGDKVADFKSASVDMSPFERAHLYAYWDTEGVNEGEYLTKMTLNYADRSSEKEIRTKIGLSSITTEISGVSVGAVTSEEAVLQQYPVVLLVAVLIAINFAWFMYFRKRKK